MHAFTVFTSLLIAAVSVSAAATPMRRKSSPTVAQAAEQCSANQQIMCCNSLQKQSADGVLDLLTSALSGSGCSPLELNVVGLLPTNDACETNIACCNGDTTGLVNVQCSSISL